MSAAPPSRTYRVRTFVRRHRPLVAGVAAVAAAPVAGVIGTGVGLVRPLDAREAEARAEQLETVTRCQAAPLAGVDPVAVATRMRGAIEERLPALGAGRTELADQPLVRARLLRSLADAGRDLGLPDFAEDPPLDALRLREEALGPEHPETIDSLGRLVFLLAEPSRFAQAEEPARRSAELHGRVLGATLETFNALGRTASCSAASIGSTRPSGSTARRTRATGVSPGPTIPARWSCSATSARSPGPPAARRRAPPDAHVDRQPRGLRPARRPARRGRHRAARGGGRDRARAGAEVRVTVVHAIDLGLALAIVGRERGATDAAIARLEALHDAARIARGAEDPFVAEIERALETTRNDAGETAGDADSDAR